MPSKRTLTLSNNALEDLSYWVQEDPRIARKILRFCEEVLHTPFSGTGKPEPLKYLKDHTWSRRITCEHRLVYEVSDTDIRVI
ncbi:Txe/YoeB family addiction module toxin [Candidatus Thiosymbion oneisti]|uniref:Txe/YoeB family addiction module toxin n=1 Tax=Candidatus Thiosymbion oneisti TaxID=589554 RepID=UPI000B7D5A1B|nr:Txe/YoeB family addiction module toxin [Candidatus Thiosymbion oneisti]